MWVLTYLCPLSEPLFGTSSGRSLADDGPCLMELRSFHISEDEDLALSLKTTHLEPPSQITFQEIHNVCDNIINNECERSCKRTC